MGGQRHDPAALPPGKKPGTHRIGAWVDSRAVWRDAQNIAPPRFVPRPVLSRSDSLYQLSYLGPRIDTQSIETLRCSVSTVVDTHFYIIIIIIFFLYFPLPLARQPAMDSGHFTSSPPNAPVLC
jgi:hypothetical protein